MTIQTTSDENDDIDDRCRWKHNHNSSHHHYDRNLVGLKEKEDSTIDLAKFNNDSIDSDNNTIIPFGRARECPELDSTACPTTVYETQVATMKYNNSNKAKKKRRLYADLAVVAMVLDPTQQYLLITRRPSYMRSFPSAWVFPGGTVHNNESLEEAMSREMKEEVGIYVPTENWKFESIWESVYPTIPQVDVPIKRHHIVIFLSSVLQGHHQQQQKQSWSLLSQRLDLCQEEVDAAVWLSRQNALDIVNSFGARKSNKSDLQGSNDRRQHPLLPLITPSSLTVDNNERTMISLKELIGIYPQPRGKNYRNGGICGMGQGSLFALEEFIHSSSWKEGRQRQQIM